MDPTTLRVFRSSRFVAPACSGVDATPEPNSTSYKHLLPHKHHNSFSNTDIDNIKEFVPRYAAVVPAVAQSPPDPDPADVGDEEPVGDLADIEGPP